MKVAIIVGTFPFLSETFILNQITGLIDHGHEVNIYADKLGDISKVHSDVVKYHLLERTYFVGNYGNSLYRLLNFLPILLTKFYKHPRILFEALNIKKYGREAKSLRTLYLAESLLDKQLNYDIIHCHFGPNGIKGIFLRNAGIIKGKIVTTFHGRDVHFHPKKHGRDVYNQLFKECDLFTVNSKFTGDKIRELGCKKENIIKHPVGLELERFAPKKREVDFNHRIKIVTVGRLVEKKGIEYSIRAVSKVLNNHSNLEYKIVGEGALRRSLETLITELGLENEVKLLGWKTHDELQELYDESHIFILSSVTATDGDMEGQGLVLQEAQAMGLPVLSTLHNGIPDGVLNGKSGFLVPERDIDALADKINYLVENPEVWSDMGMAGRRFVEQNYDIHKLNSKLVEIYQDLLEKH